MTNETSAFPMRATEWRKGKMCATKYFALVRDGAIRPVTLGKTHLITREEHDRFFASLPPARPALAARGFDGAEQAAA
jgi:hypothetical protein